MRTRMHVVALLFSLCCFIVSHACMWRQLSRFTLVVVVLLLHVMWAVHAADRTVPRRHYSALNRLADNFSAHPVKNA